MKKIYKIILVSLGVFIFLLITGTNLVLKGVVVSSLENALNRRVSMGSLSQEPFLPMMLLYGMEMKSQYCLSNL